MALDKIALLAAMALKKETVKIGDGEVIVTELSADEYMAVYDSPLGKNDAGEYDGKKFTALLAARCITNEAGERIFADEDAQEFFKGSFKVYSKITAAVNRVNGLTGEEAKN